MAEQHETWDEILLEKLEDIVGDDLLAALATEIATLHAGAPGMPEDRGLDSDR